MGQLKNQLDEKNNVVLLTGDTGMLGQSIKKVFTNCGYTVYGISRSSPDYSINLENSQEVMTCIEDLKPDIIINTAAMVDISRCERDPGEAYLINAKLPGTIAQKSKEINSYFIQISTDHFFIGDIGKKHTEDDEVTLCNEYAQTKYLGECLSLLYSNSLVVRTNVVGFRNRGVDTFVEWIIHSIKGNEPLTLFDDFYTSSITSVDFARILIDLINIRPTGVINIASSEVTNKEVFVCSLVKSIFGFNPVYDRGSVHSNGLTSRADSLGLDVTKAEKLLGYSMPGLKETIKSLTNEYHARMQEYEV